MKIKSWWFGEVYQITLTTGSRYHLSVFAPIHTDLAAARWTQIVSNVACFSFFSAIQFLFLTPLQWRYLASCHSACHSPPCSDILDKKSSRKMLELLYKGFVNSSSDSHLFIIWLFSKSFCKYLQGMTQTNLFKYFKSFAVQQIKTNKRLNGRTITN